MFLKKKRCGKIKGRVLADVRKKREGSQKSDVSSTIATTELVLITVAIDTTEGRDVAVMEAPGAFLTADMDKEVIIILENKMVDKDIYRKCVIHGNNGK